MEKIYSTVEVATMFNVTSNTIKKWIREENINCLVTDGGHIKLSTDNIESIKRLILNKYNLQYLLKKEI